MSSNLFGVMDEIVLLGCFLTCALCFIGLYSRAFSDNWGQTVGLATTFVGCLFLGYRVLVTERATWPGALVIAGVSAFGGGTAWKVWKHTGRKTMAEMMPTRKVQAGVVAGATMAIVAWAAEAFAGVKIPAEIALAGATVITAGVQWFVPDAPEASS